MDDALFRDTGRPRADEVEEMAIEIGALVLDCLSGEGCRDAGAKPA